MAFQDFLVNIRIHKKTLRIIIEVCSIMNLKNGLKIKTLKNYFKKNRYFLMKKLDYLKLINLLLNSKSFDLIFGSPNFHLVLKN